MIDWKLLQDNSMITTNLKSTQSDIELLLILSYQAVSEDDIREIKSKINDVGWCLIGITQRLSESFIREFQNEVDWYSVSVHQPLSEDFIREFQDKVDWYYISCHQTLSESFIREFQDKVDWYSISVYQLLSDSFIKEFNLSIPETNWLYWTLDQKREYIKKHTPYELDDDCLYAYKATLKDGKSIYRPSIRYTAGNRYSVPKVDCNMDVSNSFGLAAWTKKGALDYYSQGNLYLVKIHLNDLGCITKEGKIRCKQLTIIKHDYY